VFHVSLTASQLCGSLLAVTLGAAAFPALADDPATAPVIATAATHRTLDLTPPDIRKVMPSEELNTPLPEPNEADTVNVPETVQVKGSSPAPEVPGGILSVFWALWHPTQAWRIVTPVQ
jgi:hypothetical protein